MQVFQATRRPCLLTRSNLCRRGHPLQHRRVALATAMATATPLAVAGVQAGAAMAGGRFRFSYFHSCTLWCLGGADLSLAPSHVWSCGQVTIRSSAARPLILRSSALCTWRPEHVATRADSALSPAQRCAWDSRTTLLLCPIPCTFVRLRWAEQAAAL